MLDGMKPPLTTSGVGPIKRLDGEEHIRTLSLPEQYSGGAKAVASETRGDHLLAEQPQYSGTRFAWEAAVAPVDRVAIAFRRLQEPARRGLAARMQPWSLRALPRIRPDANPRTRTSPQPQWDPRYAARRMCSRSSSSFCVTRVARSTRPL